MATDERAAEARQSAEALLEGVPRSEVVICDFRDGFFPYDGQRIKDFFEGLKGDLSPDVVFTHQRADLHQDHRLSCELTWNTFRDHLILEYEVPKYDGDMSAPNAFVPLSEDLSRRKIEHLMSHFGSQLSKALVPGGPVLGPAEAAGDGVQLALLLRRGLLLPQGGARVTTVLTSPAGESGTTGSEALELMRRLFPLCRSLTGDGVRGTFDVLEEEIPITRTEIPSGTRVFDWVVPDEWNLRDAYIARAGRHPGGRRLAARTLHVVSYSEPVRTTMPLEELRARLHTLPDQPDVIPYRTSYYERTWGFCLSHRQLLELEPGDYEVVIDSTLEPGHLSYAELEVPGEVEGEVLISTYVCHPSLANDNLSGIAVATMLAKRLLERRPRHTYRFLFAPGTIGPLAWLHRNRDDLDRIEHGLTLSCIGDAGDLTYKRSRRGDAEVDRAMEIVLRDSGAPAPRARVGAVGRRRAPVLLARLRPAGRHADADAPRRVRRLPHLGRLARADPPGVAGSGRRHLPRAGRCARQQPPLRQPQPLRRAAARATRPLPLGWRSRRHAR